MAELGRLSYLPCARKKKKPFRVCVYYAVTYPRSVFWAVHSVFFFYTQNKISDQFHQNWLHQIRFHPSPRPNCLNYETFVFLGPFLFLSPESLQKPLRTARKMTAQSQDDRHTRKKRDARRTIIFYSLSAQNWWQGNLRLSVSSLDLSNVFFTGRKKCCCRCTTRKRGWHFYVCASLSFSFSLALVEMSPRRIFPISLGRGFLQRAGNKREAKKSLLFLIASCAKKPEHEIFVFYKICEVFFLYCTIV